MEQILRAAIISGALVIGLLAGFSVGSIARSLHAATSGEEIALPPQQ